jgi:hypothetical protein
VPGRGGELGEFGVMPPGADEDAERLPPGPPRVIHGLAGTRPAPCARAAAYWSRLFLEPDKLGFQVPYSLLEAAHLGNDARIGTADVAE